MHDILERLSKFATSISTVVAIAGVVVSLLGTVIGRIMAGRLDVITTDSAKPPAPRGGPPSHDELEQQLRIPEARARATGQEDAAKWFRRTSSALSAGQYLVGAALASAFVQSSLGPGLIGVLGLVVLLSQATRNAYRPELRALGATKRALRLKQVVRSAEDDLYALGAQPSQPSLLQIRRRMSEALADIEKHEAQELETQLRPAGEETGGQRQLPGRPPSGPEPAPKQAPKTAGPV